MNKVLVEVSTFQWSVFRLELLCSGLKTLGCGFCDFLLLLSGIFLFGLWPGKLEQALSPLFVFLLRLNCTFDLSFGIVKPGSQSLSHTNTLN